jgi:hypothetical protein
MANNHTGHQYNTLEEYLASRVQTEEAQRKSRIVWKKHVEKHGNVPLIEKCSICSGKAEKLDRKHGMRTEKRPTKSERDEEKNWDDNE